MEGVIEYKTAYHWEGNGLWHEIKLKRFEFAKKYVKPGDRVLDIGCGDGFLTDKISYICREVSGIDPSVSGIKFAKDKIENKNISLIQGSATNLPFKDNSYDAMTLFEMIEHLPENQVKNAIEEIFRVLKKDGCVIITTPNPRNLMNRLLRRDKLSIKHPKEYTHKELKQVLLKFKTIELTGLYLPIPIFHLFAKPRYRFIYNSLIRLGGIIPKLAYFSMYCGKKVG